MSDLSPLETETLVRLLMPGDVLGFCRTGTFNWLIRHATKSPVSHTETSLGGTRTIASRNGLGVATYDIDLHGLGVVLRPIATPDIPAMLAYQASVAGQKYAWRGLARAFVQLHWGVADTKQWCSEHTTNAQRAATIEPFDALIPADMVAPGDFLKSPAYRCIWKAKDFPL